jgi:hypothetical protein
LTIIVISASMFTITATAFRLFTAAAVAAIAIFGAVPVGLTIIIISASMFTMTATAFHLVAAAAVAAIAIFGAVPVSLTIIIISASMFTMTATAFRLFTATAVAVAMAVPGILRLVPGGMATAAVPTAIPSVFPTVRVIRTAGTVTVAMAMAIAVTVVVTVTRHLPAVRMIGAVAVVFTLGFVPVFRGIFAVLRGEMVVVPGWAVLVGVGIVVARVESGACDGGSGAGRAESVGGVEGLAFGEAVGRGGWGGSFGFFEEAAEGEPFADDRIGRQVQGWFFAGGHGFASI